MTLAEYSIEIGTLDKEEVQAIMQLVTPRIPPAHKTLITQLLEEVKAEYEVILYNYLASLTG